MTRPLEKRPSYRALLACIEREAKTTLECMPEDLVIEGNCSSIDPQTDREQEQWIRDQLDSGNEWAWCTAHVEISWRGFTEHEYLGACSYLSEANFVECGERDTMRSEACIRLARRLHKEWETIGAAMRATRSLPRKRETKRSRGGL